MSDSSIPFIQEYGEWAVEDAAMRTARGWRKGGYSKHTVKVPENKKYLAANSAKRNPTAPRGARFPARPSKRNRTMTLSDDDGDDDGRIPTLPPGPSTDANPIGFHVEDPRRNPQPPPNHAAHLAPGSLQPTFGSWFCPQMQSPVTVPNHDWERSPPCA